MGIRLRAVAAVAAAVAGGALALSGGSPVSAQTPAPERAVKGDFSLIMMVHTSQSTQNFAAPATNPWDGRRRIGTTYSYRSIACTGLAPVNNISSDLPSYNTRIQGSRAPSSLRAHPFRFHVRRAPRGGGWEMKGRMVLTVCKLGPGPVPDPDPVPDADKPKIHLKFTARFKRGTAENLNWKGTFRLVGGTGRYKDLSGSGSIAGYFFCFDPNGCASTGQYRDGQMVLHGDYEDPTPQLAG